jgi:hypothetical protein
MTFVLIDERGRCTIPNAPAGPYDSEIGADGTIHLVPLVRATDRKPPSPLPMPTNRPTGIRRRRFGRDWTRIPAGTAMVAPHPIGRMQMGGSGKSPTGGSMNQYLLDNGISRNAWDCIYLEDGRSLAQAYDAGEWS